jgi:hypothetical protein
MMQLVEDPHLAWHLSAGEVPEYLSLAAELLTRVTELRNNLARMVPRTTRILGRPLGEVRRVLRLDEGEGFDLEDARRRITGDDFAARRFLADLVTGQWLVQDRPDHWVTTAKAKELQLESRGKLTRTRADGLVAELIVRAHAIDNDPKYAFKIDAIVLFGSYLSARERIGDVDVAVALRPRLQNKEAQKLLEEEARSRGPEGRNLIDHLFKPQREVRQALKAKSSGLDVRDISELQGLLERQRDLPYTVVFGYWQPKVRPADQ